MKFDKKILAVVLISIVGGFLGSFLYINYGQSLILTSGGNQNKDNTVSYFQDDNNKLIKVTEDSATIDIVKEASVSVVSVNITKDISNQGPLGGQSPFDEFFFFGSPQVTPPDNNAEPNFQKIGGGSGFIISADGYILTNKHVVEDAQAKYSVVLNDGKEYEAEVVGTDLFMDIGILKIKADNLKPLKIGDSSSLQIGQTVIAIGNALAEFSNTVTKGVVSGVGRSVVASSANSSERLDDVIQTDAAINPGNSGGPLLNLAGEVVGINTAVSNQGQLIGFAIPINPVKKIIDSVISSGEIVRPYLGVRYVLVNADVKAKNNLKVDHGALILRGSNNELAVLPGSPADKAGLLENDIILAVDGQDVTESDPLSELISKYNPGQTVEVKIMSKGVEKTVKVTLDKYQASE